MEPRERKGPRLFVETSSSRGDFSSDSLLTLSPSDSHYIRDVLRLRVGDPIEIGDRDSTTVYQGTIISTDTSVSIKILEPLKESSQEIAITLVCALCKGQKNDHITDWATELGCSQIVFFQSDRSIVRLRNSDECAHKETRISKIATAAAQQSRQVLPPQVKITLSLDEALKHLSLTPFSLKAICSLSPDAQLLSDAAKILTADNHACVIVGPEGDFSPEEHEKLLQNGFIPTSLGAKVLRSELAVVTALVTIQNK
jgi:16S rRNA (uracil1498-N3)-methyltransferase